MVDMDAAVGFVVTKGDPVERARLSWLRTGAVPPAEVMAKVELGQAVEGGWPAVWGQVASVDATCFHLTELDDLGLLGEPTARKALDWLASRQRPDGTWEEDESLAEEAPAWARPGDPEARLYLTASAAFWLAVAQLDARGTAPAAIAPAAIAPAPGAGPPAGGSAVSAGPPVLGLGAIVAGQAVHVVGAEGGDPRGPSTADIGPRPAGISSPEPRAPGLPEPAHHRAGTPEPEIHAVRARGFAGAVLTGPGVPGTRTTGPDDRVAQAGSGAVDSGTGGIEAGSGRVEAGSGRVEAGSARVFVPRHAARSTVPSLPSASFHAGGPVAGRPYTSPPTGVVYLDDPAARRGGRAAVADVHSVVPGDGDPGGSGLGPVPRHAMPSVDSVPGGGYSGAVAAAARAIAGTLTADGTWPSFLVTGWLGAAVLHSQGMYYEAARMQTVLTERLPEMSPADVAWMAACLRRVGVPEDGWLLVSARRRLAETQRADGGWPSDDGAAFDAHTTLAAIRASR